MLLATLTLPAFSQSDVWSSVGFGISSYPEENGNITEAYLSYRFTPVFSPVINIKTVATANTGEIPDADTSLNLTRETTTEVFIYPASFGFQIGSLNRLYVTGGLYISSQQTREVGFFDLSASTDGAIGLNSYDNSLEATFYGPVLNAGMGFELPFTQLTAQATVVPFFLFGSSQSIGIDPLVSESGENDFSGSGFPYIALKFQPTFFKYLSPDIAYEFQRFNFESLAPNEALTGWDSTESTYSVHTVTIRGSIRIPLFKAGNAEIGYGRKLTWTVQENGDTVTDNKGTFKLTFNVAK